MLSLLTNLDSVALFCRSRIELIKYSPGKQSFMLSRIIDVRKSCSCSFLSPFAMDFACLIRFRCQCSLFLFFIWLLSFDMSFGRLTVRGGQMSKSGISSKMGEYGSYFWSTKQDSGDAGFKCPKFLTV